MFKVNDPVYFDGKSGRVFSIGHHNTLHVLTRVNDNTWKVEKWYGLLCRPYIGFLWSIESAFRIPHHVRYASTPELSGLNNKEYPYMLYL